MIAKKIVQYIQNKIMTTMIHLETSNSFKYDQFFKV